MSLFEDYYKGILEAGKANEYWVTVKSINITAVDEVGTSIFAGKTSKTPYAVICKMET